MTLDGVSGCIDDGTDDSLEDVADLTSGEITP